MHHRPLATLAASAVLLLAACSSSAPPSAPATEAIAAPTAEGTAAPTAEATAAPTPVASASEVIGSAACAASAAAGEVSVAIADFAFIPADIAAKVGQAVTFTNSDSAPHTATVDDGSCTTPNLAKGDSGGLLFTEAGTYPFHCRIHPRMKGSITVS